MCDNVYSSIMQPINQCNLMGVEKVLKSESIGDYRITVTTDNFRQYRVTAKHKESNQIVSSILFDNNRIVKFKYTAIEFRNMQLTRQLFAYAQIITRKTFYHSDSLTATGKASI